MTKEMLTIIFGSGGVLATAITLYVMFGDHKGKKKDSFYDKSMKWIEKLEKTLVAREAELDEKEQELEEVIMQLKLSTDRNENYKRTIRYLERTIASNKSELEEVKRLKDELLAIIREYEKEIE